MNIIEFAHTTMVVSLPGAGDDIQALKAGLLEIGDIFIVNKGDKPGADDEVTRLQGMLEMSKKRDDSWIPQVLKTVAVKAEGISAVIDACWGHRQYLIESGLMLKHNAKQALRLFESIVMKMASVKILDSNRKSDAYKRLLKELIDRKIDPVTAAEKIVKNVNVKL